MRFHLGQEVQIKSGVFKGKKGIHLYTQDQKSCVYLDFMTVFLNVFLLRPFCEDS